MVKRIKKTDDKNKQSCILTIFVFWFANRLKWQTESLTPLAFYNPVFIINPNSECKYFNLTCLNS